MEDLSTALFYDTVPDPWVARAYPSMMGLAAWYTDLLLRIRVRTVSPGLSADPRPRGQDGGCEEGSVCSRQRPRGPPRAWPLSEQGRKGLAHSTQTPDNAGASCRREGTAAPHPPRQSPKPQGYPAGEPPRQSLLWDPKLSSNVQPLSRPSSPRSLI